MSEPQLPASVQDALAELKGYSIQHYTTLSRYISAILRSREAAGDGPPDWPAEPKPKREDTSIGASFSKGEQ